MPTLVLVGPPNVGKSTIFNTLTRSRAALVADLAGVTRDPVVGQIQLDRHLLTLVDTGGFVHKGDEVGLLVNQRILAVLEEADLVLLVVEKAALPSEDVQQLVTRVRRLDKPLLLLLNKSDQSRASDPTAWYRLHPHLLELSAVHRRGMDTLRERIVAFMEKNPELATPPPTASQCEQDGQSPRLVIAGRPNVGKSTLVNYLLGENRLITSDQAGTTRDVIALPLEYAGKRFTLLDTPGVRRWGRIHEMLEKFSLLKSLEALRQCDVAILLIDGRAGLLEQDLRLLTRFSELAPATVIGVNKIDALDVETKTTLTRQLDRRAPALSHYPLVHISALQGKGVAPLLQRAFSAAEAAAGRLATSVLMRTLEHAMAKQPPPMSGRFRPRLKFIHQVTPRRRLTIRISGNQASKLHPSYVAYLSNTLIKRFKLAGVNIDLQFVDSENPYTG